MALITFKGGAKASVFTSSVNPIRRRRGEKNKKTILMNLTRSEVVGTKYVSKMVTGSIFHLFPLYRSATQYQPLVSAPLLNFNARPPARTARWCHKIVFCARWILFPVTIDSLMYGRVTLLDNAELKSLPKKYSCKWIQCCCKAPVNSACGSCVSGCLPLLLFFIFVTVAVWMRHECVRMKESLQCLKRLMELNDLSGALTAGVCTVFQPA